MANAEKRYWMGFDLGGTKMLAAVFDDTLTKRGEKRKKTRAAEGVEAGFDRVVEAMRDALDHAGITAAQLGGIGMGCPGPLDLVEGVLIDTPNLGWKQVQARKILGKAFGCPVHLINDVDAGIYGEFTAGAARGARCAVGIFPGTGIGGGGIYEGQLLRSARGSCFEIGHVPVMRDGPLCGCGRQGCLEAVASRLAIAAAAGAAALRGDAPHLLAKTGGDLARIRSKALAESIAAGDKAVERIVRDAAGWIGFAAAGVVNLLAPDVLVLGGGLVEALPKLFLGEVKAELDRRVMPAFRNACKVVEARLGDDAAALGAAAWALHQVGRSNGGRPPAA